MTELNREALLIYLNDVRVMETVIYESRKKKNTINNLVNEKYREYMKYVNGKPEFKFIYPESSSNKPSIRKFFMIWFYVIGALIILSSLIPFFMYPSYGIILILIGVVCLGIGRIIEKHFDKKDEKNFKAEYKIQYSKYEERLKIFDAGEIKRKNIYNNYKKNSDNHISKINNDIRKMQNILNQAYSANIIPNQFRNIQGVYYLYDYLSTSNQSLSEALLQCNLEAIKQKLDKMISLQSAMVVEIAQQNAKTDEIIQQNRELLSSVKEVGVHTANAAESAREAAQYAQISATNSEITRELAEKQLAYQSAEFWLRK